VGLCSAGQFGGDFAGGECGAETSVGGGVAGDYQERSAGNGGVAAVVLWGFSVFLKIMRENEKVKKLMDEEGQMKREQEGEGGQGGREIRVGGGGPGISIEEFCSYV
jgi:hypothetical protein